MLTQPWELSSNEYGLYQEVRERMGEVAATSLACVLLDGATRFMGISPGEVAYMRQLAEVRKVKLPI